MKYYEVEMIPMGEVGPNMCTADETEWTNGQTYWNIFVTERTDDDSGFLEILDLDIPVAYKQLADLIFHHVEHMVNQANLTSTRFGELMI